SRAPASRASIRGFRQMTARRSSVDESMSDDADRDNPTQIGASCRARRAGAPAIGPVLRPPGSRLTETRGAWGWIGREADQAGGEPVLDMISSERGLTRS